MDEELLGELLAALPDQPGGLADLWSEQDFLIIRGYLVPRDPPVAGPA